MVALDGIQEIFLGSDKGILLPFVAQPKLNASKDQNYCRKYYTAILMSNITSIYRVQLIFLKCCRENFYH